MHLLTSLCFFVNSFDYLFFKIIDKQSDNRKSLPVFFRVWKAAGECTHILEGHSGAITSVSVVNSEGRNEALSTLSGWICSLKIGSSGWIRGLKFRSWNTTCQCMIVVFLSKIDVLSECLSHTIQF